MLLAYLSRRFSAGHEAILNWPASNATVLHKRMQLLFVFVLLFPLARSSNVESDLLSSVDIIAFAYSQQVSHHWDCPQISDRAEKAEEARVWRMVIPDAHIEETAAASASRTLRTAEKYRWIKEDMLRSDSTTAKSKLFMQSSVLLGMRKPNFDDGAVPLKLLHSMSRQVNQDALSVVLPQLEQSKDNIMDWMAHNQASLSIPNMTPNITDPLTNNYLQVPQAASFHPRVFKDAHFTTGDLVAWMALAAESRQKGHEDAFKFFKIMLQSFLPGFDVKLEAVPKRSAGKPTKTIYLHRSFRYIPVGADLAFYFDGNLGKFLSLQRDSIVLNRPEGIVDGQQQAALVLFSNENVDAGNLEMYQTKIDIAVRKAFCKILKEKAFALHISPEATDAEVQAAGVSTIRKLAVRVEWDSFLEAQRKLLESRPKLLTDLLPEKLVRLVIEYFNDDTYPVIVSTQNWSLRETPEIAVNSARMYLVTGSEGIKSLNHSLVNINDDKRRCIELVDPKWFGYDWFSSSHDGRCVAFRHSYKILTKHGVQIKPSTKWLVQDNESEGGRFKSVTFDSEDSVWGILSRDGQTLFSCGNMHAGATRVYRIRKEIGKDAVAFMKFELNATARAVSGKGNRVIVDSGDGVEIHDIGKDISKLVCKIDTISSKSICALNADGSEAAFVTENSELRIVELGNVSGSTTDQPVIVKVKLPESLHWTYQLVYDDGGKLHIVSDNGKVSLLDPSTKELILLEALQKGQEAMSAAISPHADYIVILRYVEEEKNGKTVYRTIVKRRFNGKDWEDLFRYEADKDKEAAKQS